MDSGFFKLMEYLGEIETEPMKVVRLLQEKIGLELVQENPELIEAEGES